MKKKTLFAWSGGKDCALALYEIQRTRNFEISALLSTMTKDYDRISMHGVRRDLLEQQVASLGFPLEKIPISRNASNNEYESEMRAILERYQADGVSAVVFGDIFLEDVRKQREQNLSMINMKGLFPLWRRGTSELAETFIELGFKAIITCVDSKALPKTFVGRTFDKQFLSELPSKVDPCGENGEFHSFVYEGPIFQENILYTVGEVVMKDNRFYYCDLISV